MSHRFFALAVLATAGMVVSTPVSAEGFYAKIAAGWNIGDDQDYTTTSGSLNTELDDGYALIGALGYDYGQIRAEGEISVRDNDIDTHQLNGTGIGNGGNSQVWAAMVNGYVDFDNESKITPYVGAGVGIATVYADSYASGGTAILDDQDTVFAYQFMAGAEYAIGEKTQISGEYRYFDTQSADIDPALGGTTTSKLDYSSHTVLVGLKHELDW